MCDGSHTLIVRMESLVLAVVFGGVLVMNVSLDLQQGAHTTVLEANEYSWNKNL